MQSKTFCVMPHIGLSIQNHGDLCVCNRNDHSLKNEHKEVILVHKDRLRDAWFSPTRKHIINLLDSGTGMLRDENNHHCQDCYDSEQAGVQSPRQQLNEVFKDVIPSDTQPRVLIIKPGNVCNLACRMCNPETSSSWYVDSYKFAKKYEGVTESLYKYTKKFEHIRNGFNKDNVNFWNDIDTWLPNLVFFDIYGGEPFLSNELFASLDKSPTPTNTSLKLHTNLTIYNEDFLKILTKYKSVHLGLSIDSHIPSQLNYIRYPADAEKILENLEKFKNFLSGYSNVSLNISCCVNTLNIINIDEIYRNLSKFEIPVGLNFVSYPSEYDVRALPTPIKSAILENNPIIKTFNLDNYLLQEIPQAKEHFKKFWQITKDLDSFRDQDLKNILPEYYQMLESYVN